MHYNSRSLMFADWRIWLLASMLLGVGFTVAAAAEPVGPPVIRRALPLDGQQAVVLHTNYGNVQVVEIESGPALLEVHRRRHDGLYLQIENGTRAVRIDGVFAVEPPEGDTHEWPVAFVLRLPKGTHFAISTGEGHVVRGTGPDAVRHASLRSADDAA